MVHATQRWLLEPTGAFVAGALLAMLATTRLRAFPALPLCGIALAAGVLCALPWLLLGLARLLSRAETDPSPARTLLRACVLTGTCLGCLDLAAYFGVRRLAVVGALVVPESTLQTAALPLLLAVVSVAGAWGLLRLVRRLGDRAPAWPWLAGATAVGLIGACLGAWRPSQSEDTATTRTTPGEAPPELLVIGIDAVGDELFERFRDRMPTLSRFAEGAARGSLEPEPPYLSPAIWTSIATGLGSEGHGVSNYELWADRPGLGTIPIDRFYGDPATTLLILPAVVAWRAGWLAVLPSTRLHRRGTPFWQHHDGEVGVICWPATWPAEPTRGLMVSDRWPPDRTETLFHYREDLPDQVWPAAMAPTLAPLRRDPAEDPDADLLSMAAFTDEERAAFLAARQDDLATPRQQPFANLHYAWLNDRSCLGAARWMLERQRPTVAVVYLMGPDLMGHAFLPRDDGSVAGFDHAESQRLGAVYGAYLERLDEDLAWLLGAAGPDTTTVVLSDHGMQHQGTGLFSVWHAGDGMVLAQGPGLEPGGDLGRRPASGWMDLLAPQATRDIEASP